MQTFDWIVVGNGLTGAALSYELVRHGCSVLLLEKSPHTDSATRYSYGGIPYWSGTTDLLRQLCREGLARHQALPNETGLSTEFRAIDLLLTVPPGHDPQALAQQYATVEIPPVPISVEQALEYEPQLNPAAIAGALHVNHGHVHPTALVKAYNYGFQSGGGRMVIATVTGLVRVGDRVTGVTTPTQAYAAGQVAIAAGGQTRALLKTAGLRVPVYFTQAEIIETPSLPLQLHSLMMPADLSRTDLEAQASRPEVDTLWDDAGHELAPAVLDVGCVQLRDGTVRIGQISRISTTPQPAKVAEASEHQLRQGIAPLLPALAEVPGQWRSCQVAFSRDGLALAGPVPGVQGLAVFSGFTSPFALVPAAAVHFARWATGTPSPAMTAFSPQRFLEDSGAGFQE